MWLKLSKEELIFMHEHDEQCTLCGRSFVNDAIDVAKKGIEKCIRDMHAAMPEELIQMELDKSEQNAEMIKAAMKKQLTDTGILEK